MRRIHDAGRHTGLFSCFAALVLAVLLFHSGVVHAETFALVGARVHTVSGPVLPQGVVVVEDGRIVAVGRDVTVPPGATVVDLRGKQLYPGLINADTVLGLTEIGAVAATVDTREHGRINPNVRAEVAVNPSSELIPVARSGGVLMALTTVKGSGLIAGTSAVIYTDGWTWEEMTMHAPTALVINWPAMRVNRSPNAKQKVDEQIEAREERIRMLREAFADARAFEHATSVEGVPHLEEDVKWDAMRATVRGELPVMIRAGDLMKIRAAIDWAAEEGVEIILVGAGDSWRIADELAARDIPVILRKTTSMPMRDYEPYDSPYATAARLHTAGVRFAFSTGGASTTRNLSFEAGMAVGYGLPAAVALHAMTLGAAEILGIDDRVGSIEVGKEATLIATSGDVLDFRARVTDAWIDGREVDLMNRHRRLYETYNARPR